MQVIIQTRVGHELRRIWLNFGNAPEERSETSRLLSRLRRPVRRLNTELFCVLGVQPLPAGELRRIAASDAANGSSAEKMIQNIERDVPASSTHGDEAA